MHLEGTLGVAFFAKATGIIRNGEFPLVKLFEQVASVLEQSLAQTQLDGFAVASPVFLQILADQSQEGFGFLEPFAGDFLWLEFFLLPESGDRI
jgi:hypothetical protein